MIASSRKPCRRARVREWRLTLFNAVGAWIHGWMDACIKKSDIRRWSVFDTIWCDHIHTYMGDHVVIHPSKSIDRPHQLSAAVGGDG